MRKMNHLIGFGIQFSAAALQAIVKTMQSAHFDYQVFNMCEQTFDIFSFADSYHRQIQKQHGSQLTEITQIKLANFYFK